MLRITFLLYYMRKWFVHNFGLKGCGMRLPSTTLSSQFGVISGDSSSRTSCHALLQYPGSSKSSICEGTTEICDDGIKKSEHVLEQEGTRGVRCQLESCHCGPAGLEFVD